MFGRKKLNEKTFCEIRRLEREVNRLKNENKKLFEDNKMMLAEIKKLAFDDFKVKVEEIAKTIPNNQCGIEILVGSYYDVAIQANLSSEYWDELAEKLNLRNRNDIRVTEIASKDPKRIEILLGTEEDLPEFKEVVETEDNEEDYEPEFEVEEEPDGSISIFGSVKDLSEIPNIVEEVLKEMSNDKCDKCDCCSNK